VQGCAATASAAARNSTSAASQRRARVAISR
jgi:hypothetical protein